jgi:hypothetical protein
VEDTVVHFYMDGDSLVRVEFEDLEQARKFRALNRGHLVGRVWYSPTYTLLEAMKDADARYGYGVCVRVQPAA